MVMTTSQKRNNMDQNDYVFLITPSEVIEQSESGKLLGALIHQDMKWGDHVLNNDESLVRIPELEL